MADEKRAASGPEEGEIDSALAQCEAALAAIQKQLLADEALELLDIGDGFAQLKELPTVDEHGTVGGGLSSFTGRLAGFAKISARLGAAASKALGAFHESAQPPVLN